MKIDTENFDAIKTLSNFAFFGYDVIYGPARDYFKQANVDNIERTKIIFKKPCAHDKLILCIDNDFKTVVFVCRYVHRDANSNEIDYDKKYDLSEFDGDFDDLNDDIEFWAAKLETETMMAKLEGKTYRDAGQNEYNVQPSLIGKLYTETDAKLTARLMNVHGLVFRENNPINKKLRYEPPFTVTNIIDWFDEAYHKLKCEKSLAVYANGPIHMTANKDGSFVLNISLICNYMPAHDNELL